MNANKLADKIDITKHETITRWSLLKASTMLRQQQAEIEALKAHLVKELTEILATIKCLSDEVSPYKEYENTYSDGWLDACNTVYDEVFAILRKAQEQ